MVVEIVRHRKVHGVKDGSYKRGEEVEPIKMSENSWLSP